MSQFNRRVPGVVSLFLILVFAAFSAQGAATFSFNPSGPTVGETVTVKVTDSSPWAYVNVQAIGPNTVNGDWVGVKNNGNGTWTWTWTFSGLQAASYAVRFTSDNYQQVRGETTLGVSGVNGASFVFNPASPKAGEVVTVKVTDSSPWAYVNVRATGPNTVNGSWVGVKNNGNGTWTWTWTFSGLQAGNYTVQFSSDNYQHQRGQTSLTVQPVSQTGIAYTPASPTAGQTVTVKVTDSSPWVHVGLQAVGPNTLSGDWVGVKNNGNGTWTWTWTLSGLVWGDYTLRFTSDHGTQLRGQATMQVGGSTSANNALFQMSPPNPAPGQEVTVRVTSNTPYVNTKLQVNRSGTAFWADDAGYQENDNYYNYPTHTWIYKIPGNRVREGLHNLTFAADNGATVVDQTSMPVQARSMRAITNSPFGFNGHFWWTYNCSTVGDRIQRFIDEYRALGAQTIRIGIDWKTIEKREGDPKYAFYDELLNRFNDAGIRIIGLFYTAPDWATIDGQEWNFGDQLNRSKVGAMRSMAQKIAQRYPFINHWEFWNEPQIHSEMANGEEFAFWFRNFSEAIKAVNYQDKVSFGTILETENQAEPHTTSFIKNVMTALQGYQPDAISIHPYGGYDVNKPQVELVHSLVPHIPLWVTEFGWFNYSEVDQTNALEEAINWLRSRPYVEFATMHMLHDFKDHHDTYCWFSDDTTPGEEEGKHGLVTEGFYQNASYRRKQAWYKFRELALGLVCESPSNLAASSITRSTARISWTGVSGALHYRVAYKPSADVSGWKYVTTTTTNFTLTELQPNTEYVYLLRAYCPAQGEWSAYTSNKYFTTNSGCQSPSGMGASASSTYASVSWNAVGGATSYRIAYKPTNAKSWLYKTVGGNRTTLTRLTPGAIYVYRIQTYCPGNGWTSYSGNRYFTTRGAVKIGPIFDTGPVLHRSTADEPLLGAPIEVSVYPNPVSQGAATLRIQVTEEAPLRVDLYDPAGRNLGSLWEGSLAPGQHQLELALPSMSSGLYWLEVRLGDSSRTLKLGVQ